MDVIAAYRDMGSYRGAAELCGTTHKTVKRIIEAHEAGSPPAVRVRRARNYDAVAELVAEKVKATSGRISAKRLLPVARAAGYEGSDRLEVTDVLLHEMIHASLILAGLDSGHNSGPWCAEVERLSPPVLEASVKAAPVVPRRVDGRVVRRLLDSHLGRKHLAGWPRSLRSPAELAARGRPIPVPTN